MKKLILGLVTYVMLCTSLFGTIIGGKAEVVVEKLRKSQKIPFRVDQYMSTVDLFINRENGKKQVVWINNYEPESYFDIKKIKASYQKEYLKNICGEDGVLFFGNNKDYEVVYKFRKEDKEMFKVSFKYSDCLNRK